MQNVILACMQMLMTEVMTTSEPPLASINGKLHLAVDLLFRAPFFHGDCWLLSLTQFLPWMITAIKQHYHAFMDDRQMQLQLCGCFVTYTYCLGRYLLLLRNSLPSFVPAGCTQHLISAVLQVAY